MNIPENLLYTDEHEWISVDGDTGRIGITDYAQHHLGDIVFVELPEVGESFAMRDAVGVIESVKAVVSLYTPASGTILEVNEELEDSPELLNEAPYDSWIAAIKLGDKNDLNKLMNAEAYAAFCQNLED
ncbi:MAG: glycine cleavage system protein GcvH [Syntrophomonadaceae bacterium]|nr:glycine cleavage system protein GcvH [Syntrophomonadaceae bacterium]